ncbi:MAG: SAM hydroxide adenosyltransferase [Pyrinomonadaceae bacterium]
MSSPRSIGELAAEAEIIHIVRFGNLIANLRREDLPGPFTISVDQTRISKRNSFFAETRDSELFMFFGSSGYLEICAFGDSAKRLLGCDTGKNIIAEFHL